MSEPVKECTIDESKLYTREFVIKAVVQSIVNVSKDLYNLGLDDLSAISLTIGDACLQHIDENKDKLVYPREPGQPFRLEHSCSCTCKSEVTSTQTNESKQCHGHQNVRQDNSSESMTPIESEVTEIVSKIRAGQSKE
jgi:hypothetical protein